MSQSRTTLDGDQSFILVTLMYDLGVTLKGEIRCQSWGQRVNTNFRLNYS